METVERGKGTRERKRLITAKTIEVIERRKKPKGCRCPILSAFLSGVSEQKQCVQDYKHTIIPVFITVHHLPLSDLL